MNVQPADPRASRAVLIGSARYHHLPELPAVTTNLADLAATLADEHLWGLPAEHCRIVRDAAEPRVVGRAVRETAASVAQDGLLLVYFAGHGLVDPHTGGLHLALPHTEAEAPQEASVPYDWISWAVAGSPARWRVVILDCCYAGRAAAEMAGEDTGTTAVANQAEIDRACLLVSAPRNRTAQAPPEEKYTAFTGELLRVLREGVPDGPPVLDVHTVWTHARRALRARGMELPEVRAHNGGDSIPLVRNAARSHRDLVGRVLVAAPGVDDRDLRQAVLLVLRHDRQRGAVGIRLNTPTARQPADLSRPWSRLLSDPSVVFDGGPVEHDGYVAIGLLRPGAQPPVRFAMLRDRLGTVALTGAPDALREALRAVRVFGGYVGWGPGQLERDLDAGMLLRTDHPVTTAFATRPRELWYQLQHST